MMRAQLLTAWIGDGLSTETAYRPQLLDDYQAIVKYTDATGQQTANIAPTPNMFVAEFVVDAATLAAIELDPRYYVLEVLDE